MAVMIGSARIDERGRTTGGGKAGDQNKKEVSTQNWYLASKGWRVFRAKDHMVAREIAVCMKAACDNDHIGYDQSERNTLYHEAAKYGFDVSKVSKNVETDCSALVRVCCAYAGVKLPNFITSDEAAKLMASGAFIELTADRYTKQSDYLMKGDILVTRTKGHTVVVLSDGPRAEKNCSEMVRIIGGNCYVREKPNTSARKLGVVRANDQYIFLDEMSSDGWYKVEYKNNAGWVSGKYAKKV